MCKVCTREGSHILKHARAEREYRASPEYLHEVDRINQFQKKARDDNHFRQLILNRASKCGPSKRERFIKTLHTMGRSDLAGFIEMCLQERK